MSNGIFRVRPRHLSEGFPEAFKETGGGISCTVPNQSYTLRELIARYRCGQRLPVSVGGDCYDDDVNLDEVPFGRSPNTDLVDATIYQNALERRIRYRRERARQGSEVPDVSDKPAEVPGQGDE